MGDSDSFLHGFELPSLLLSERESKSLQEVSGGHGLVGAGIQRCVRERPSGAILKKVYLVLQKAAVGLFVLETGSV